MPWLKRLAVSDHWTAHDFDVDLTTDDREQPLHLILTGPNGSGKTTILNAMVQTLLTANRSNAGFDVEIDWTELLGEVKRGWKLGRVVAAYLPATRRSVMTTPDGPTKTRWYPAAPQKALSGAFLQHLVNQQVQARLADGSDPKERAERDAIFAWFANLEAAFGELFERPGIELKFDRKSYDIRIEAPGMPSVGFNQLAAGHASTVAILAELILRIDAADHGLTRDSEDLSGVVAIDELALHLHPSLQEKILPFLTRAFPRLQFIVATHSPAIICSVPDAMVVDLGSGRVVPSRDLQGTPYGELMRTHFGIETDIDLASTRALQRLEALDAMPSRTPEEERELTALAERLTRTSHPLALHVWNRITARRLRAEARAEAER